MMKPPTIGKFDQQLKQALAGIFQTTALDLFILLGGKPQHFDAAAREMMEWHLRYLEYKECEFRPLCWSPKRTSWQRNTHWPEDKVWIKGDLNAILDHLETVCE